MTSRVIAASSWGRINLRLAERPLVPPSEQDEKVDDADVRAMVLMIHRAVHKPEDCSLLPETGFRALEIALTYMRAHRVERNKLTLLGVVSFVIAAKVLEEYQWDIRTLRGLCGEYRDMPSAKEVSDEEARVLEDMGFDVSFPSAHTMLLAALAEIGRWDDTCARGACEAALLCALASGRIYGAYLPSVVAEAALAAGLTSKGIRVSGTRHPEALWKPLAGALVHAALSEKEPAFRLQMIPSASRGVRALERCRCALERIPELTTPARPRSGPAARLRCLYDEGLTEADKLGSGTFGTVIRGKRTTDGTEVALKMFRASRDEVNGTHTAIVVELSALALLQGHPLIVGSEGVFLERGTWWSVSPLAEGGNLESLIKKYKMAGVPLPLPFKKRAALQLLKVRSNKKHGLCQYGS